MTGPAKIERKRIVLDGKNYENVTFFKCELVVNGLLGFSLESCNFQDCHWSFDGPAANTIKFMAAMYRDGMTEIIEQTFNNIRGIKSLSPDSSTVKN